MGEILSVDMRLNDTRRERAAAARRAAQQSNNLLEQMQVLEVQVQDYENEVRAPGRAGGMDAGGGLLTGRGLAIDGCWETACWWQRAG